jgi:pyruvate formate lyase activating enzyme
MMVKRIEENCINCGICSSLVLCPVGDVIKGIDRKTCVGCGACIMACPKEALILDDTSLKERKVFVDDKEVIASGTVKNALIASGIKISKFPDFEGKKNQIFMPCECGGCWACLVMVDRKFALGCLTPLYEGMKIQTILKSLIPLRVVSGFGTHTVGGVGTPYWLKGYTKPIEVAGFTHGCNLRCLQCQNFNMAFTAGGHLLGFQETAQLLLGLKEVHRVERIALSGGECTLNREWLVGVVNSIREVDREVHIHIDTNGTILTPDYIDELINAGMTDVGIDLKSLKTSTFMHITGLDDEKIVNKYLNTSWRAAEYIINNYIEEVFLGIGIPYNRDLVSRREVECMGQKIYDLSPVVQVCILDYRPEFRRRILTRPSFHEMLDLKEMLNSVGLETVVIQTSQGHFGP